MKQQIPPSLTNRGGIRSDDPGSGYVFLPPYSLELGGCVNHLPAMRDSKCGLLDLLDDGRKCIGIVRRDIGEHFPIQIDISFPERPHQA